MLLLTSCASTDITESAHTTKYTPLAQNTTKAETTSVRTTEKETEALVPIELTYSPQNIDYTPTSPVAFIVDTENAEIICMKGDPNAKIYPASVTKLVTALLSISCLDRYEKITVGDEIDLLPSGASVAGLKKGDTLTVDALIYCLLLPSGGDAAYTLAVNVGRRLSQDKNITSADALSLFVDKMNEYAIAIGMENTLFESPDGFTENEGGTTPYDMALLGTHCTKVGTLKKYTSTYEKIITLPDRRIVLTNTNALVNPSALYYLSSVTGLKTGNTDNAGYCLLALGEVNNKSYLVGIFSSGGSTTRFADARDAFLALGAEA